MRVPTARAKRTSRPEKRLRAADLHDDAPLRRGVPSRRALPAAFVAPFQLHAFETELGWMAALGRDGKLVQLMIGCDSPAEAIGRLNADWLAAAKESRWCTSLVKQLRAYAAGSVVSFADVAVENRDRTPFQIRVLECCRKIAWGGTLSYGELASLAGRNGAARAVGNVMAGNRCPLVIPCHRVVHGDGRIGRFSAPQGAPMKRRLLALETVGT